MSGFPDPNDPAYMDTPDVGEHPIEDTTPSPFVQGFDRYVAGTPERRAQRDRLAALRGYPVVNSDEDGGIVTWSPDPNGNYVRFEDAARLIAADVRVADPAVADLVAALDAEMAGEIPPDYAAIARLAIAALRKAVRVGPDEGLRAAAIEAVKIGCIRMHWGAQRPCDEYDDGRALCAVCALRVALEGSAE